MSTWPSVSGRCCHNNMRRTTWVHSWFGWDPVGLREHVSLGLRHSPAGGHRNTPLGITFAAVIRATLEQPSDSVQAFGQLGWAGRAVWEANVARCDWHQSQLAAGTHTHTLVEDIQERAGLLAKLTLDAYNDWELAYQGFMTLNRFTRLAGAGD